MAELLVISALVKRRAELTGEIEAAEQGLDQLRRSPAHVDAVLRLYAPDRVVDQSADVSQASQALAA